MAPGRINQRPVQVYAGPASRWVVVWIWLAGGLVTWSVSLLVSIFTAAAIADVPQPNQQLWIAIVHWSPALPIAAALVAGTIFAAIRRNWRAAALAAAHGVLWPSLGLIFLWIPKAP